MSTTAMWLLLAVVVIVIVFASVLYKRTFTVHELALTGVMAALSLVAYLFFRVPFYGLYGACSTMGESLSLASLLIDGGYADRAAALTCSRSGAIPAMPTLEEVNASARGKRLEELS